MARRLIKYMAENRFNNLDLLGILWATMALRDHLYIVALIIYLIMVPASVLIERMADSGN